MHDLLQVVSLCYLLVALSLPRAWSALQETHWVRVIYIYLPPVSYVVPPLGLLVASALMGDGVSAVLNGCSLACVLTGVLRWCWNAPATPDTSPDRMQIRVLSYNIFGGSHAASTGLGEVIERTRPDVVFLQEAWWAIPGHRTDPLPDIVSRFPGWSVVRSGDFHELCILTRFPVLDVEERAIGNRVCLVATLRVGGRRLRAIDVHLTPPATGTGLKRAGWTFPRYIMDSSAARHLEAFTLRDLLLESSCLTLVGGDFNSPPTCFVHRLIPRHYRDAFSEGGRGCGHTWFERLPLWRLDYILTSPDIRVLECRVLDERTSDHRPVVADVELPVDG